MNGEQLDSGEFRGMVITKLDDIKDELKTLHGRIDKRDNENQDLIARVTRLETTQSTLKWIIGIGIAGAGAIGAILAAIFTA